MPPGSKRGAVKTSAVATAGGATGGSGGSGGGLLSRKKKKDKPELGKAQTTLARFFTTPAPKPSSGGGGVGGCGGGGPTNSPSGPDGKKDATKSRGLQQQKEAVEMTYNNSSAVIRKWVRADAVVDTANPKQEPQKNEEESPSSAAKAVRFNLTQEEKDGAAVAAAAAAAAAEKAATDSNSPRGAKRNRQGSQDEGAEGSPDNDKANAGGGGGSGSGGGGGKDEDEDVIMCQRSDSRTTTTVDTTAKRDAAAGGDGVGGRRNRTRPPKIKKTNAQNQQSKQESTTVATTADSVKKGPFAIAAAASADQQKEEADAAGSGVAAVEEEEEGFVTPAHSPGSTSLPSSPKDVRVVSSAGSGEGGGDAVVVCEKESATVKSTAVPVTVATAAATPEVITIEARGATTTANKASAVAGVNKLAAAGSVSSAPHPLLEKYVKQLTGVLVRAEASGAEEWRPDRRMGLKEAVESVAAAAAAAGAKGDGSPETAAAAETFPEHLAPLLARVVQGSPLPLSRLSEEAMSVMKELAPGQVEGLTASQVAAKISLVAQRKSYGAQPKKVIIPEDRSREGLWVWEVQLTDLLPADKAAVVKQVRTDRANEGKLVKALVKLTEVMKKFPGDAAKISKEEEKVMVFARKEEALRQKANLKEAELAVKEKARKEREDAKEKEKRAKGEDKRKKQEEKELKKAEEKRLKAEAAEAERAEKRKHEEAKLGKVSLLKFFKVAETAPALDAKENVHPAPHGSHSSAGLAGFGSTPAPDLGRSLPGKNRARLGDDDAVVLLGVSGSVGRSWGGGVEVGAGGGRAVVRSKGGFDAAELEAFEQTLRQGGTPEELLARTAKDRGERSLKRKARLMTRTGVTEGEVIRPKRVKRTVTVEVPDNGFGNTVYSDKQVEIRSRTKLLQFHQDHRPAYWGTWSKTSRQVTGRRPLGKDTSGALNYDYDSEGDWEEEAPGEDLLSDEEGDKEPEDNLDYKDGWLRQDDEFSDDELDRFDAGSARQRPENPYAAAIGVGAGVRIGAGAAAGGAGAKAGGGDQQAFVAALMFRRGRVSEEEASAHPALRALSAYRAVACGDGEGEDGGGGGGMARFPVPVVEALVEKPRRKDTVEGGGKEGSGDSKKDDKAKPRKHKDFPHELMTTLVEKLHGKPDKREDVVNAFVAQHPLCTKKAVTQKVKEISTRERSVHGGFVFVVAATVLEDLKLEKEDVPLKPSPAEAAAIASAAAAAAAVVAPAGGSSAMSPGTAEKAKGGAATTHASKLVPPPGQRSLLSFLNTKGSSPGDSSPSSRATPKVLFGPSGEAEAKAKAQVESKKAETKNAEVAEGKDGGSAAACSEEKYSQAEALEDRVGWRGGPDADGGWEETKESDPPMGRPVPVCTVLTPSKKVRQVAAARPVLYLGSGAPPAPPALDSDDEKEEEDLVSAAAATKSGCLPLVTAAAGIEGGVTKSGGEGKGSTDSLSSVVASSSADSCKKRPIANSPMMKASSSVGYEEEETGVEKGCSSSSGGDSGCRVGVGVEKDGGLQGHAGRGRVGKENVVAFA